MMNIIVSQGRIGDKTAQTIKGAARTAQALEIRYGKKGRSIGKEAPSGNDDWRVSLCQANETLIELSQAIAESIKGGDIPVMVANTCSASLASLPIVARHYPDAIVLWFDAHGDFNTPATTKSGYLGGMVLSATCGLWDSGHGAGLEPKQLILVGARDIDAAEGDLLKKAGVRVIPPTKATPHTILDAINGARVWIHIDWDVLEPGHVPADYQVPDGMLPTQIRETFKAIPATQFLGIEIAEFHLPQDEGTSKAALSIILDTIAPLFEDVPASRGSSPHPTYPLLAT